MAIAEEALTLKRTPNPNLSLIGEVGLEGDRKREDEEAETDAVPMGEMRSHGCFLCALIIWILFYVLATHPGSPLSILSVAWGFWWPNLPAQIKVGLGFGLWAFSLSTNNAFTLLLPIYFTQLNTLQYS